MKKSKMNDVSYSIPLSAVEKRKLIEPPMGAFNVIKFGYGTKNEWITVMSRIYSGLVIARNHYEDDTLIPIFIAKDNLVTVYEKYSNQSVETRWVLDGSTFENVESALFAINEMQSQVNRKELQDAYAKTVEYMQQYV